MTPPSGADRGPSDYGTAPLRLDPAETGRMDPVDRPEPAPHDTAADDTAHDDTAHDDTAADEAALRDPAPDDTGPIPRVDGLLPPPPSSGELPATEQPPAPEGSRAGRNLRQAIGVGLGLGAVILASLLLYRPAFVLVVAAAVVVGVLELTHALRSGGFRPARLPLVVGSLAMLGLAWTRGEDGLVVGYLFTLLAVLLWRLADGPIGYLRDAAAGTLVALYVPLLAGFAVLLTAPDDGVARVLAFIGTVVASDVGGYVAGVLFGKHPMAPSISPKKSWEGMAGSIVGCVAVATPVLALALDAPWWAGVVFGVAIAFSATVGDLAESLIKRDLGIKDMGHLLPGHGGIMDRLDSLLPSAAVAWLLLSLLAPV